MVALIKLESKKLIASHIWLAAFILCLLIVSAAGFTFILNDYTLQESKLTDKAELEWQANLNENKELINSLLKTNPSSKDYLHMQNKYLSIITKHEQTSDLSIIRYKYSQILLDKGFNQAYSSYSNAPALNRLYFRTHTLGCIPYTMTSLVLSSYLMCSIAPSKSKEFCRVIPTASIQNYISRFLVAIFASTLIYLLVNLIIFSVESFTAGIGDINYPVMARNIDSRISIVNLNDLIPQQIYSTTICIIAVISLIGLLSSFIDNSFILVAAPLVSIFMLDSQ